MAEKLAKIKKKKWVSIIAPKLFFENPIGQSYVTEAQELLGRLIKVNMMNLTGDPKNQSTNIFFKISSLHENKVGTEFVGFEVSQSAIKRMVRKRRIKMDEVLHVRAKDNVAVTAKLLITTRNMVKSSIAKAVRKEIKSDFTKRIAALGFEDATKEILIGKLQKDVRAKMNKICPLHIFEVRYFRLESGVPAQSVAATAPSEVSEEKPKVSSEEPAQPAETKEEPAEEKPKEKEPKEEKPRAKKPRAKKQKKPEEPAQPAEAKEEPPKVEEAKEEKAAEEAPSEPVEKSA